MSSQTSTHVQNGGAVAPANTGDGSTEEADRIESTDRTAELSKNQAFDVLRNSRRRAVISCLRARGGRMSIEELSRRVAAKEYDVSTDDVTAKQYKRVYTGLYQCHLRRMHDLGVIDFEADDNTVVLRGAAAALEPYLDDGNQPWIGRVELGVASLLSVVVAFGSLGVGPFATVSAVPLAALTLVVLAGLALFHVRQQNSA